jgi:hypothetical protein
VSAPHVRSTAAMAVGLGLAAALTVALAGNPASGAFSGATGSSSNAIGSAADFCTGGGTATRYSLTDVWVNEALPNTNYEGDAVLSLRSGPSTNARVLVSFDLAGVVPAGCSVTGATLRLYNQSTTSGRTVNAFQAAAAWDENVVTWATRPGTEGTAVPSATPSANGWQSWSVTEHVQAQHAGPNRGFVLIDSAEGNSTTVEQRYNSNDGTNPPELVLTWG